jgi:peptidoglycan-N-acetylglucosamine deacetylase
MLIQLTTVLVAVVAVLLVVSCVEPLAAFGVLEWLTPNLRYRVKTSHPLVALSFDDGPHPMFTPKVLEILQQHNAKATFFLIGERALRYPQIVSRIKASGHEIGNHYFTDGSVLLDSDDDFVGNLELTEQAIKMAPGRKLFRPPGGVAWPRQLRLAREQRYECVLGSAYPHDPMHPPARYISWLVRKNLVPGTIVILHDGISDATRSIRALPQILADGKTKKLTFVSIGTLLRAAAESVETT